MNYINDEGHLVDIVKSKVYEFDDKILMDDIDLLGKYIIIRYFKMSPNVGNLVTKEQLRVDFSKFVDNIYSFIITFISVINSIPCDEKKDEAN